MTKYCQWCNSGKVCEITESVYWELPDGTKAIEITETPSHKCDECGMIYQPVSIVKNIEDQLFLVDRKKLNKKVSYEELMSLPRVLKRNYFDFS